MAYTMVFLALLITAVTIAFCCGYQLGKRQAPKSQNVADAKPKENEEAEDILKDIKKVLMTDQFGRQCVYLEDDSDIIYMTKRGWTSHIYHFNYLCAPLKSSRMKGFEHEAYSPCAQCAVPIAMAHRRRCQQLDAAARGKSSAGQY